MHSVDLERYGVGRLGDVRLEKRGLYYTRLLRPTLDVAFVASQAESAARRWVFPDFCAIDG